MRIPPALYLFLYLTISLSSSIGEIPENFQKENLVAWCIVPFDAKRRGPVERAEMLTQLGIKRCAYDWRKEHVSEFEEEILQYKKNGIEFTAFWNQHDEAFRVFEKHGVQPQIWITNPSAKSGTHEEKVAAAVAKLKPVAEKAAKAGCVIGLYNHGGWGGEPENLIAVCRELRKAGFEKTGIVYNFHHAHDRIETLAEDLERMKPYLLCVNLNGMQTTPDPKILPIGEGEHEAKMIRHLAANYRGAVGILDHRKEIDAKEALEANLSGLRKILAASQEE
ncbi:MAG: TIM barrel protein [Verrucomicrobiota bacterium]